ncbi:MAG: hypothetical protein F6K23_25460 [Okeania sp. SIO2C9]|nr:hypothetical protein [Okeania sp. SIO2C9]NEQ76090.1 hypothetical protein [Okeania sp. SIO2C9]
MRPRDNDSRKETRTPVRKEEKQLYLSSLRNAISRFPNGEDGQYFYT